MDLGCGVWGSLFYFGFCCFVWDLSGCSIGLGFGRGFVLAFKLSYLLVFRFVLKFAGLGIALTLLYSSADKLCL